MSSYAANVARWNAIPMARKSPSSTTGTKRSRSRSASPVLKLQGEYDSSDEDKISLVSRSPSPHANKMDIEAYDKYHPAAERDVITIETKIKSTNKGYSMLAKLGWTVGQPLGLSGDGLVDPIPFSIKNDVTGLGKRAQDERMIETTVSQRRGLDSERQIRETVEQRQTREQKVAEQEVLRNQIASTLKHFYCALCDKQYQTVAQYDEHTNSYAHHHKQRFKDMQTNAKGLGGGRQDKEARLAKERKREAMELKRMAKAQGMKVSGIGGVVSANASTPVAPPSSAEEYKGFKKSGWATVSTPAQQTTTADEGKGLHETPGLMASSAGPTSSSTSRPASRRENPGFRTAGFETLETTSSPTAKSGDWSAASNADDTGPEPSRSAWAKLPTSFAPLSSTAPGRPPPPSTLPPPPPSTLPPPPPSTLPPPPPSTLPPPPPPPPFSESPPPRPPSFPPQPLFPPRYGRPPSPRRELPPRALYPHAHDKPRFNGSPSPLRRDDYNPRDSRDRTRYHTYQGGHRE